MKKLGNLLLATFSPKFIPTPEELTIFVKMAKLIYLKPQQSLLESTEVFDKVYFVVDGVIRSYAKENKTQYTIEFFTSSQFILQWQSFDQNTPSEYHYEAILPTVAYYWDRSALVDYLEERPHLKVIRRIFVESYYLRKVDRLISFQTDGLKEIYQKLIANHGVLMQKIPQHYLASYIGVKPQSLSRVKRQLMRNNTKEL